MTNKVIFQNIGLIPYKEGWEYQEKLFQSLVDAKLNDDTKCQYLIFCEHNHVYTLGKNGDIHNLLISDKERKNMNIDYFPIDRGGDITYHGPGQLVSYPIIDLEDYKIGIKKYISMLEDVVIKTLSTMTLKERRIPKQWVFGLMLTFQQKQERYALLV